MSATAQKTRVALVQLCAGADVEANLTTTERLVRRAAAEHARVVLLPEAFAFIGPDRLKRQIVEPMATDDAGNHPILDRCRELAVAAGVELVLGGHHEAGPPGRGDAAEKSYNTCVHIGADGRLLACYRKIHLFDVQLADGTVLEESARTLPGSEVVLTNTPFGALGLTICYDLRFPYLYQALAKRGAIAISVPSAFTATTGAAHWHALLRARAIETQCYVLAPAQHGQHNARRRSYGHSLIVDPWGEVIAEQADGDGVVIAELDPQKVRDVRAQLPSLEHQVNLGP